MTARDRSNRSAATRDQEPMSKLLFAPPIGGHQIERRPGYLRLLMVARLIGAWVLGILVGVLVLNPHVLRDDPARFFEYIVLGTRFFGLVSLPLLGVASIVAFAFERSIASYPFWWTLAAVATAAAVGFAILDIGGLIYSLFVSVPAAMLFLLSVQLWPAKMKSE
jgi:hypothetical protein